MLNTEYSTIRNAYVGMYAEEADPEMQRIRDNYSKQMAEIMTKHKAETEKIIKDLHDKLDAQKERAQQSLDAEKARLADAKQKNSEAQKKLKEG